MIFLIQAIWEIKHPQLELPILTLLMAKAYIRAWDRQAQWVVLISPQQDRVWLQEGQKCLHLSHNMKQACLQVEEEEHLPIPVLEPIEALLRFTSPNKWVWQVLAWWDPLINIIHWDLISGPAHTTETLQTPAVQATIVQITVGIISRAPLPAIRHAVHKAVLPAIVTEEATRAGSKINSKRSKSNKRKIMINSDYLWIQ